MANEERYVVRKRQLPLTCPADVPEAALDPEWRALVRQQARTLAGMFQRMQTAVAGHRCNGLQSKRAGPAITAFSGPHYVPLSPVSGPH